MIMEEEEEEAVSRDYRIRCDDSETPAMTHY